RVRGGGVAARCGGGCPGRRSFSANAGRPGAPNAGGLEIGAGGMVRRQARSLALAMRRLLPLVYLLSTMALAPEARAGMPGTVFLEDLTWTELAAAIKGGKTTVLLP